MFFLLTVSLRSKAWSVASFLADGCACVGHRLSVSVPSPFLGRERSWPMGALPVSL